MKVPGLDLISLRWVMWPFLNKPCGPWPGSVTIRFYDKVHVTILEAGSGVSPTQTTWTGNGGGGFLTGNGSWPGSTGLPSPGRPEASFWLALPSLHKDSL